MAVQLARHLFTVEEFHRMGEAGVFAEDDRVELIEGEIVEMTPIGSRHASCVDRLNRLFSQRVGERAIVRVQSPVRLGAQSEPQPNVALLKPREDFYARAHPEASEVLLLVEVADATAEADRQLKIPVYSRAGVAEVWLVDLTNDTIEVYCRPTPQGYQERRVLRRGDLVVSLSVSNVDVAVDDVLG